MTNDRIVLLATLPKSGTWYCHTFFWCYEQLLQNCEAYGQGTFSPDLETTFREKKIANHTTHTDTLGIKDLYICHSICPGFYELNAIHYQEWQAMQFALTGYNWGESYLQEQQHWDLLNPKNNPHARIIYVYRNPLDHFVSYFNHAQTHIDDSHRFQELADGTRRPIKDIYDFVFNFGVLNSFIKHYYSFKQMHLRFPENILLVPYENLTTDPEKTFHTILSFMGSEPDNPFKKRLFFDALTMSSKESLSQIETKLGGSLLGDQIGNKKHIRDSAIGKWQTYFSQEHLEMIESIFNLFDISLNEFHLYNTSENKALDSQPDVAALYKKQEHQINFLKNELDLSNTKINLLKKQLQELHTELKALHQMKENLNKNRFRRCIHRLIFS